MNIQDKVALVTGGSRGIGRAVAEQLSAAGAKVAIMSRDPDGVKKAVESLPNAGCGVTGDVSDIEAVNRVVSEVEETLGPVDILVNNAGMTRDGLLARMSADDWQSVMDVNLAGAFYTMKRVTRGMMKRRFGRVVNITSVVGLTGNRGQANYAASKAGLVGLTKSVAKELASRNVTVNAVAPGFIETDMTDALNAQQRETLQGQIPLGRLGHVDDVARAVLFLSSDWASYVTGQVLVVDGGMVM